MGPVHVLRWLWEREIHLRLLSIAFFKKFKYEKTNKCMYYHAVAVVVIMGGEMCVPVL